MPRWQTASGVRPVISAPWNRMEPALGVSAPEMQLNSVVFPEPLGPMSPRISPSVTSNETPLSAVKPPKRLTTPLTLSTRSGRQGPRRGPRQEHGRGHGLDGLRPHVTELAIDDLVHGGERALV